MNILVTGAAGFIGAALSRRLLKRGDRVVGIDNINDYYDVNLKHARLERLTGFDQFSFVHDDIANREVTEKLFNEQQFDIVVNLAAQPGVRYSIENPHAYIDSNLVGFCNILEGCRHSQVGHLVYASSSSVYGANEKMPFSESDNVDHPVSLYAATKKANELMAHTYSHLYDLPTTGLRFFTVYGPWGRPDMALLKFANKIVAGEQIDVYNNGNMIRDFTYIDDIVEGVLGVMAKPSAGDESWSGKAPDPAMSKWPYQVFNIGNSSPQKLMRYIEVLEDSLGIKANCNFMPMQPGEVLATQADTTKLQEAVGYKPDTTIEYGIGKFAEWYKEFYQIK